jgi:hypothetical protein
LHTTRIIEYSFCLPEAKLCQQISDNLLGNRAGLNTLAYLLAQGFDAGFGLRKLLNEIGTTSKISFNQTTTNKTA